MSSEVVETYINAILHEPTNKATSADDESTSDTMKRSYLFRAPLLLPKYLEQFSIDEQFLWTNIVDGPGISPCKGIGDRSHQFLTDEGCKCCAHW